MAAVTASSSDPLYCPACIEPFDAATNPAGLAPCFHPLCQRCIDKTAAAGVGAKPCECMWIVEGGYCQTPFTAAQLVSGKAPVAAPMCTSCKLDVATHHCNDCNLDLCADEIRAHQKAGKSKTHATVALNSAVTGRLVCPMHIATAATQFCDKCDQLACVDCLSEAHAGHPFIALAAGQAKRAKKIEDMVNQLLKPKKEQCLATIASVREQIDRLEKHKAATQQQIRDAFDPLIAPLETTVVALKARRTQLHEKITKAIDADIKALAAQCCGIVITADHLKRVEDTQQQLHVGPADETQRTALAARIKTLSAVDIPGDPVITTTSAFVMTGAVTPMSVLNVDISTLGEIETTSTDTLSAQYQQRPARDYSVFDEPKLIICNPDVEPDLFKTPWALAIDAEGHLIVGNQDSHGIQIMTRQGELLRVIKTNGKVSSIAFVPNGNPDIWAAIDKTKLVRFNFRTGAVMQTIKCEDALCLCRLDDGSLVVTCENKVVCFAPNGTERWSSTGEELHYARGITAIPNQELVAVCSSRNNCIQLLSTRDGHFVRKIDGFKRPGGILYDPATQILLVGLESYIVAATLDGREIVHRWAKKNVSYVHGMAIADDDGTLFVCDSGNNRILAF